MDPLERIDDLLMEAEELDYGPAKTALVEEAVREADASGDLDAGFETRKEMITAATFSGQKEKAIVAFTWCLAQVDADPERFDEYELMWPYKWVAEELVSYPQISRAQIGEMLDDMGRRYAKLNLSPRPVHYMRWTNAMRMGDLDYALEQAELWYAAERDGLADCLACERNKHAELAVRLGKDAEAVQLVGPILQGKMKCECIPHATLAQILAPLVRLGRIDEAHGHHRKGYRLVAKNRNYVEEFAAHLFFLARVGEWERAVDLFEKHLPIYLETTNVDATCRFHAAAATLLEKLAREQPQPRHFRLPRELPAYREDETYAPAELGAWFEGQACDRIALFDARNGNDYYSRWIAAHRALARGG